MTAAGRQTMLPVPVSPGKSSRSDRRRPTSQAIERVLQSWGASPVFDAYWHFAAERQRMLVRRLAGDAPPWTDDNILAQFRFTNPYRFSDRVSQFLIKNIQYNGPRDPKSLVLRTLIFKIFNRIPTWLLVADEIGEIDYNNFDPTALCALLDEARMNGQRIYSGAYIIPNPPYGQPTKHANHLHMVTAMLEGGVIDGLAESSTLEELFYTLIRVPSLGPFLAFQYAIDINYSPVTESDELDFVIAGPGAKNGLRKCFTRLPAGYEEEAIYWVTKTQADHFERLGIEFSYLFGRKLRPIDCQNLFCEIDKYSRVRYPEYSTENGRQRIKQGFSPCSREMVEPLVLPIKWWASPAL